MTRGHWLAAHLAFAPLKATLHSPLIVRSEALALLVDAQMEVEGWLAARPGSSSCRCSTHRRRCLQRRIWRCAQTWQGAQVLRRHRR